MYADPLLHFARSFASSLFQTQRNAHAPNNTRYSHRNAPPLITRPPGPFFPFLQRARCYISLGLDLTRSLRPSANTTPYYSFATETKKKSINHANLPPRAIRLDLHARSLLPPFEPKSVVRSAVSSSLNHRRLASAAIQTGDGSLISRVQASQAA